MNQYDYYVLVSVQSYIVPQIRHQFSKVCTCHDQCNHDSDAFSNKYYEISSTRFLRVTTVVVLESHLSYNNLYLS